MVLNPNGNMLPILEKAAIEKNKLLFSPYVFLFIQHVMRDFLSLLEAFELCGLQKEKTYIIGIPYSTKYEVADIIKDNGYNNVVVPKYYPIDNEVSETLLRCIKECEDRKERLIIIEDGGYAVPILHNQISNQIHFCQGAVEQTTRGIWEDEKIVLNIPIISIPDCELKKHIEPRFVGKAVVDNIKRLLSSKGDFIIGRKVGLLGFGSVGEGIAFSLDSEGATVYVADTDPKRLLKARMTGGFIIDDLGNIAKNCHMLIGASGRTSINGNIFPLLSDNTILVSASSRQVEIDVGTLNRVAIEKNPIENVGTEYTLNNGKKMLLIADGYPVNFFGSESVPDKIIDLILTLLFEGVVTIAGRSLPPGIFRGNDVIDEKAISLNFIEEYNLWG